MSATANPGTEPGTESEQDIAGEGLGGPQSRPSRPSAQGIVVSSLVILGIAAGFTMLLPRPNSVPRHIVDVAQAAAGAGARLGFVPAVPAGLPPGWTATSAAVRDSADGITTWHIGYVTSDGHYASIEQAAEVTSRWEEIMDSGGTPIAPQTVDGTVWEQRYKDVRDVVALIHRGGSSTIMVTSKGGGLANATVLARSIPAPAR